ncbi:MAG: ATP-binding cassette domain-containing protein [Gallionella sp.]|nr:ATP-binding cassette domain-containing protein [Gallionella sp.]
MLFVLHGISVRHASAGRGDSFHALNDVSMSVEQGERVALIGPSGAGKTTLLHTLACAHRAESGEFSAFGVEPWALGHAARHALRARLFLAPQTPPLPPRQRVVTAVLAGCLPQWSLWQAIASLIRPINADAAYNALSRFGLQNKLYSRVDRLSGGERQRCGMARLLVSKADVFLVDEPLSALDPALSLQTLNTLLQEADNRNATLVCSLHQVELALSHFPRIVGLRNGRIVFDAARAEVTDSMIAALYQNAGNAGPGEITAPPQPAFINPQF